MLMFLLSFSIEKNVQLGTYAQQSAYAR
jgi:hypothetical protein